MLTGKHMMLAVTGASPKGAYTRDGFQRYPLRTFLTPLEQTMSCARFGVKAYLGDAMRPDLLHAAGIEDADLLVVTLDNRENITELVRYVTDTYPHIKIVARALDRHHIYEQWSAGARDMVRETFDNS